MKDLFGFEMISQNRFTTAQIDKNTWSEEMLDLLPGSVSIMGLANDTEHRVQLVIDREVLEGEYLGCHPCMNTSSIKLKTKDVLEKFLPAVRHTATVVDLPWPVPEEGQPG